MIIKATPLSMAESCEYVKKDEVKAFIRIFTQLKPEQGKELREKLMSLNLIKLNDKHISKLIDILPTDNEELLKIMADANLDQTEIENVLQTIKEFK